MQQYICPNGENKLTLILDLGDLEVIDDALKRGVLNDTMQMLDLAQAIKKARHTIDNQLKAEEIEADEEEKEEEAIAALEADNLDVFQNEAVPIDFPHPEAAAPRRFVGIRR